MRKAHRNRGFTLIELLVAVALMLILVGAVATIFKSTSDIMLRADATMSITQNGRAMLEIMSRDLASVQVGPTLLPPPIPAPPNVNGLMIVRKPTDGADFLEFDTITSWRDPVLGTGEGVARIRYRVTQTRNRWSILRGVSLDQGASYQDRLLAQYVVADKVAGVDVPRMRVEYYWDPTPNNNLNNDARFFEPDIANPPGAEADAYFNETNLPSAVRLTIYMTGRRQEIVRPFSQVFWIATGVR